MFRRSRILIDLRRRPLPVYEDNRASTLSRTHVGKDQTLEQLHKSTGAGEPALLYLCERKIR
jgi:hypothetical protein